MPCDVHPRVSITRSDALTHFAVNNSYSVMTSPSIPSFSSSAGLAYIRSVLQPLLPYDPHDYQLEGVCKLLDGVDLIALLATGAGKTGYLSMYMLSLQALSQNPKPGHLPKRVWSIPHDPAMVIVCPTISLEEDMVCTYLYK